MKKLCALLVVVMTVLLAWGTAYGASFYLEHGGMVVPPPDGAPSRLGTIIGEKGEVLFQSSTEPGDKIWRVCQPGDICFIKGSVEYNFGLLMYVSIDSVTLIEKYRRLTGPMNDYDEDLITRIERARNMAKDLGS